MAMNIMEATRDEQLEVVIAMCEDAVALKDKGVAALYTTAA